MQEDLRVPAFQRKKRKPSLKTKAKKKPKKQKPAKLPKRKKQARIKRQRKKEIEPKKQKPAKKAIEVAFITHYFQTINVAVLALKKPIKLNDEISFENGHTQKVFSMQINHKEVSQAKKGESIGLKLSAVVEPKTKVFKI